jgi:hypothetical protein
MRVLLLLIAVITVVGALLVGAMYARPNSRLGMAGLMVLITGEVMAAVYAVMQE